MIIAAIFFLIAAISAVATSFMLFPILKRHIESLTTEYVVLRIFENVFYVIGTVSLLTILTVSQNYLTGAVDASYYHVLGTLLLALKDWAIAWDFDLLWFRKSDSQLCIVSVQTNSPTVISLGIHWRCISNSIWIGRYFGLGMGLTSPFALLAMPIAAQEMVFAVWLIVKGFNPSTIALDSNQTD